jgi:PAS domain S-box-containing protein
VTHIHVPIGLAVGLGLATLALGLVGLLLGAGQIQAMIARERLRGRRHLQAVIEQMPFGVLVMDGQTASTRLANAEAARLFGHTIDEGPIWAQPDNRTGVVNPDGARAEPSAYALHQALAEKRRIGPKLQAYRRGDGEVVTFEVSAAPILDARGEVEMAIVAFQDVTERLKSEEALRRAAAVEESVAQFRLIADSAPVMLWISDLGSKRRFVNEAYVDFLGATFEEALAYDWRQALHADDIDRILREQVAGEASLQPFHLEARYRRADGEWRWIRSLSQPRWDDAGEHAGFVGVAYDVTEAKQAENSLLRINEILEERVAVALRERDEAEAALAHSQKLEAIGRLTGGVAHDFNNLLTVVIGALDLIIKHPEDAARRQRLGEAALSAARRGERLTQQLLAFARRQALRPETVDLDAMIGEMEPLLRRAVGEALRFEISHEAGDAMARVDPAQFEAALLNLIVNAVDATPAGGLIRVEIARQHAGPETAPELEAGDYIRVSVCDTGQGMTPEVLVQAFEPFFTTKAMGKGTGLGLSQVYGFARQSGGAATVTSIVGEGTTVSLYLRPATEAAPAVAAAPAIKTDVGRALDILLVEDDPDVGDIVETMLQDLGHNVTRANAAAPALAVIGETRNFDLLLTDVVMPGGMTGVELAYKATEARPGLRVLLSSGYARDALDATLGEAQWPLLRKPYTKAELAERLISLTTDTN